jgi:hypothetical protein
MLTHLSKFCMNVCKSAGISSGRSANLAFTATVGGDVRGNASRRKNKFTEAPARGNTLAVPNLADLPYAKRKPGSARAQLSTLAIHVHKSVQAAFLVLLA